MDRQTLLRQFGIPGGLGTYGPLGKTLQRWLDVAVGCLAKHRSIATLRRYIGPWRRARAFLQDQFADAGLPWHVSSFQYTEFLQALAGWAFASTTAFTGVEMIVLATRAAMRINGIKVEDDYLTKAVREAARRGRSRSIRRMEAFTASDIKMVLRKWGSRSETMVHRMIAVAMAMGFLIFARWSDLRLVSLGALYWCEEGVSVCVLRRKNEQYRPSHLPISDAGDEHSLVQCLRHLVTDLGYTVPTEGFIATQDFLFRAIQVGSARHAAWRMEMLAPTAVAPMNQSSYRQYLRRFREALVMCVGMTPATAALFGTHSSRIGADSRAYKMGVSASERRDLGRWAHPVTERAYIRRTLREGIESARRFGL